MTLRKRLQRLEAKHPPTEHQLIAAYEAALRILPDPLLHRLGELLELQPGPEWYALDEAGDAVCDGITPGLAAWSHRIAHLRTHEPIPAPPSIPPGATRETIRKAEALEGAERDAHIITAMNLAIAARLTRDAWGRFG